MLAESSGAAIDLRYMMPSCVPATPLDIGGATLDAGDLAEFAGRERDSRSWRDDECPGRFCGKRDDSQKTPALCSTRRSCAALSGKDLNAYVLAGLQSDHESTGLDEAREKLRRGMYLYVREGSTEQSIEDLIPVVNGRTVSRCCFATDDRHAGMLFLEGHIYHCIRNPSNADSMPSLRYGWQHSPLRNGSGFPTGAR